MATAVGDVSFMHGDNLKRAVCLMTGQTTNNGAPAETAAGTDSTAGVPCYPNNAVYGSASGAFQQGQFPKISTLIIDSTAGSGTMTGTFTLWGFKQLTGCWYPISVNGGSAIAETATDQIRYTQTYTNLGHFDRLYLQLASVGGTATAFEAWLLGADYGF